MKREKMLEDLFPIWDVEQDCILSKKEISR